MELENYIHQVMSKRERSTHLIGGNGTIRNIRVIVIIEDFHKICCRWKKDIKGSASKKFCQQEAQCGRVCEYIHQK